MSWVKKVPLRVLMTFCDSTLELLYLLKGIVLAVLGVGLLMVLSLIKLGIEVQVK